MKKLLLITAIILPLAMAGCAEMMTGIKSPPQVHKVIIEVKAADLTQLEVKKDVVHKSMTVPNPGGSLSNLTFTDEDRAFIKIFSAITVADCTNLWQDISYLYYKTKIRQIELFINSPGGDAFSGLALADQIERAKKKGFFVEAHASGIVASAAVPLFAVCNKRLAAPGTIFMVHETSIWKWPGRETASDIRSQNRLMNLLKERYIEKLVKYSKLSKTEWEDKEFKTTWFSAQKALDWGLADKIE